MDLTDISDKLKKIEKLEDRLKQNFSLIENLDLTPKH